VSKGRKRQSLRELSRAFPSSEEFEAHQAEIMKGPDRPSALVACAWVDAQLIDSISMRINLWDENAKARLFENEEAPMSTMAARILVGRALRLYGNEVHGHLDTIRRVRNVFAHSNRPITFATQEISLECLKLPEIAYQANEYTSKLHPMRVRYLSTCYTLVTFLGDYDRRPKPRRRASSIAE
jgi:hypothetical protein